MSKYAQYDPSSSSPTPVIGWYDTGVFNYPKLPPSTTLIAVTDTQWSAHFTDPNGWVVSNGQLVESE